MTRHCFTVLWICLIVFCDDYCRSQKIHLHAFNQSDCETKCTEGLISDLDVVVFKSDVDISEDQLSTKIYFQIKKKDAERYKTICSSDISTECNSTHYRTPCQCERIEPHFVKFTIRITASISYSEALIVGTVERSIDHEPVRSEERRFPPIYASSNTTGILTINNKIIDGTQDTLEAFKGKSLTVSYDCISAAVPCVIEITDSHSTYQVQGKEHSVYYRAFNNSHSLQVTIRRAACRLEGDLSELNRKIQLDFDNDLVPSNDGQTYIILLFVTTITTLTLVLLLLAFRSKLIRRLNYLKRRVSNNPKSFEKEHLCSESIMTSKGNLVICKSKQMALLRPDTVSSHDEEEDCNALILYDVACSSTNSSSDKENTDKEQNKENEHTAIEKKETVDSAIQINCNDWSTVVSENGLTKIIEILLKCVDNVNGDERTHSVQTALLEALKFNLTDIASLLNKHGADVDYQYDGGTTPLMLAAEDGEIKSCTALIKHGASVNKKKQNGTTALILAAEKGHADIVDLLLSHKADINVMRTNGFSALMYAVTNTHNDVVSQLIKHGADVNAKTVRDYSVLMMASYYDSTETVQLLVEKGANVNDREKEGWTPLMIASQKGFFKIVELLIKNRANVNERNYKGETALMFASSNDHKEIVEKLINNGADVNMRNIENKTALMFASENGFTDVAAVLKANGACETLTDSENAGMIVLENDHQEIENYGSGFKELLVTFKNA